MGADCCASKTNNDSFVELRSIDDSPGILILEFGNKDVHWSSTYPDSETFSNIEYDPTV